MITVMNELDDPVQFGPKQLVPTSKLVRNFSKYLDQALKRPVFISREQEVEAVLINIEEYRELLREEEKVEELYFAVLSLRRLIEHAETLKPTIPMDDVLAEFGLSRDELLEE